ncbi:MAG: heparinase II/III family protein [Candidatus Jettenia sp.]|nr:MAG: heparinase II/III family protein [Candidatus Jettenia sp.]
MNIKHYLKRAVSLPPHIIIKKISDKIARKVKFVRRRQHDMKLPTFTKALSSHDKLGSFFKCVPVELLLPHKDWIIAVTEHYLAHRFDLLGSGWVQVRHGMRCRGVEGHVYYAGREVTPDKDGHWLEGRINRANVTESKRIWRFIDGDYSPINWHLDFKSGYLWSGDTWFQGIPYGHEPGVDIKVPWELARMQHLALLVWAYSLSKNGREGFHQYNVYRREFCNQVLDFIATNPPRFGVNWRCTMDVGIRVSNWLVTYDLFKAYGAEFDREFDSLFLKSIYEHGLHIVNNLEWDPQLHGNHYLANIIGLLFVAAYLPCTPEIDVWLAFAMQELVNEVEYQFTSDGVNFEASTSYHRLAAEMVVYGTALIMALPSEKLRALKDYDYRLHHSIPKLRPAPTTLYSLEGSEEKTPFPVRYLERLEKMAEFAMHITMPDGHVPQIGDNDSGRFLKLQPVYQSMTVAGAKMCYNNLDTYNVLPDDTVYWYEDHADHRHLAAAINGIFQRHDFADFATEKQLEYYIVKSLCNNGRFFSYCSKKKNNYKEHDTSDNGLELYTYPGFGLYIYKSKFLYLAVRCGHIGQNGNGGHAHNDQLSIELAIHGVPIIVDPGTYLYTPLPEKRNLFRSTAMHNTLSVSGKEQNTWHEGRSGLFGMLDHAKAKVVEINTHKFLGEHRGFGTVHRRLLDIHERYIHGFDECNLSEKKTVVFHIASGVKIYMTQRDSRLDLHYGKLKVRLSAETGEWSVHESFHSPGYGIIQNCQLVKLQSTQNSIRWLAEIVETK